MITIEKTVISETEPQVTNVGWFKPSTGELKYFSDGWKSTTPPVATAETLGGVKVGEGLSVTEDGTLSASGGGGDNEPLIIDNVNFNGTRFGGTTAQFTAALSAYQAGRTVLLRYTDPDDETGMTTILGVHNNDNALCALDPKGKQICPFAG